MKLVRSGALLLATALCSPVFAADFTPASKVTAVTVYPESADVMRQAEVKLPAGEHRVILAGLPQGIDPQSIRVEGEGTGELVLASVDAREAFAGDARASELRDALEKKIEALGAERAALELALADADQQRSFVLGLAERPFKPSPSGDTASLPDATSLAALADFVAARLKALSGEVHAAQLRRTAIDRELEDLNAKLGELTPEDRFATEVAVNVASDKAFTGQLRVSYRVANAAWTPYYDARLSVVEGTAKAPLVLERKADVRQSTGEDWTDVTLTLSTARAQAGSMAPQLDEDILSLTPPAVPAPLAEAADAAQQMTESSGVVPEAARNTSASPAKSRKKALQQQAAIVSAGFQANYIVAGHVSIPASGQTKKVSLGQSSLDARLEAVAVPRLDATAYLTALFTMTGEGPQLPGAVNLHRDGVFMGQGRLPLLNPGEEAILGFGADDLVKVTRAEVKRIGGEEGLFSSSSTEERAWDIVVKNLHGFAMPITITDRIPVASSKDILVTELSSMTQPTLRDAGQKRGLLNWSFKLEPKAEKSIKTGYKVSWPEGVRVGLVD